MKIAIVSRHDPNQMSAWSGTPYFITKEIRKISDDVVVIRPVKRARLLGVLKAIAYLVRKTGWANIDLSFTNFYSQFVAREVEAGIEHHRPDVVIGIAASPELANVQCGAPVIHLSDATYAAMIDYYRDWMHVPGWLREAGNRLERRIIEMSDYSVYPSYWASESAQRDYGASPDKLRIIKFGANVAGLPETNDAYFAKKFSGQCKLLFIGKDWKRKGGEILLSAYNLLREEGFDTSLAIVGCDPFKGNPPEGVTVFQNINKDDPDQYRIYDQLFSECAFFVLPTQAEAFGIVFSEAAAFATPVLAPYTGGVPTVVDNGVTGQLLPLEAGGREYADMIVRMWDDKEGLLEMGQRAQKRYVEELNWDKWRKDFGDLLHSIVDHS